ncbi:MAG: cation-transporting P-type ATPase [Nitrospiraceae bacterium]|nr:MAG: cation-transporting P-type ATPase [Nitrospiraceae bacterium]
MNIHNLSKDAVLKSLLTSATGLAEAEAVKRLHEYGLNEIKEAGKSPLYKKFMAQFTHFFAVLLWFAAGLCFLSGYFQPGEGLLSLGIAIIGVIIINAIFTFIQEYRAEKAIEALKELLPFNVKVIREGQSQDIRAENVVPGDLILLSEGDKVPADARLIEANRLMVNNAPLTGESDARLRSHEAFNGDYFESPNIVFAGTLVVSGMGRAVTYATGMSTEFGKIAHLTGGVQERLGPLQKEIIRVTRIVAVIAMATGVFFFSLGFFIGRDFWQNFLFAIGIIIANVPEGLLPTVTLSLAMGSQRMAKKKALIKTLTSVETLGSVTVICTDKTGTLTQNRMEVERVWTLERQEQRQGVGRREEGVERKEGEGEIFRKNNSLNMLMTTACLCNNATVENGNYKGDPTDVAILRAARGAIGDLKAERIYEIPFDSERKRMTTVYEGSRGKGQGARIKGQGSRGGEGGVTLFTKGAVETVLPLCTRILEDNEERPISDDDRSSIMQTYHSMMDEGLRVIAFAFKETVTVRKDVIARSGSDEAIFIEEIASPSARNDKEELFSDKNNLESNLTFAGLMGFEDPPRPEVPDAIKKCQGAGIKIIMITGDASRTAAAIAKQIGLVKNTPVVIEGHELNAMPDSVLRERLLSPEIIFARMMPAHKMRIVSILEDEGERVAVTGDGVNDAPALKKANIGIAMGMTGTDVAREAADMVLLDDNFASIVNAIEEGRAIFENIRKFMTYIFAHLTPEVIPYIMFAIFKIPLPLTVMQILAIDLGTETIPALALGIEKPEANIMEYPPRPEKQGLIDRVVLFRGYIFLGLISTIGVLFVYFHVLFQGGWQWGMDLPSGNLLARQATTATFLGIVIMQIANVFACRSSRESVFRLGFFSNKLILLGIVSEIILTAFIVYHPWGNKVFDTAPVGLNVWLALVPFCLMLLFAEELRKWVLRRK